MNNDRFNKKPKVSIIIPFYNSKRFLIEAIDSVFSQSYQNWELLLVDDGSKDGSKNLAIQYASKFRNKVKYLHHKKFQNKGLAPTRNLGLKHSQGEFIAFLDSDDVWLEKKLDIQVSILEENPDVNAVFNGTLYWYSWSRVTEKDSSDFIWEPWKTCNIPTHQIIKPPSLVTPFLIHNVMPCIDSLLIRSRFINEIGGWSEDIINMYEDQELYMKLFSKGIIYIAEGYHEKYRIHEDSLCSVSEKEGKTLRSRINFLIWVRDYCKDQDINNPEIIQYLEDNLAPYRNPLKNYQVDLPMPVGLKDFGDLHRTTPVSRVWGFDRGIGNPGQPIDRYYIETYLENHAADIQGYVLEIGDPGYTYRFGKERVTSAEVLEPDLNNPHGTYRHDLSKGGEDFPENRFDCFLLIETLLLIYDIESAIVNAYKALKPGGVLLVTLPGISQICRPEMEQWGDYWRLTSGSAQKLFGDVFGEENVTIETYGNVLSASAFLFGLASSELKPEELDYNDPDYQLVITVRVVKQPGRPTPMSKTQELDEIKSSKAWKLALRLRRIREVLIPRGSLQARLARKSISYLKNPKQQTRDFLSTQKAIADIIGSGLFDRKWYLANNPDVAQTKINPYKHYLLLGGFEARNPGPGFNSSWYLETNPDVKQAGINPLIHYVRFGKNEGRKPTP